MSTLEVYFEGKQELFEGLAMERLERARAHAQRGQKVVVLVDEYDQPLLDVLGKRRLFKRNQRVLRKFYKELKGATEHLRFVFLTGITRFSHLNIFHGRGAARGSAKEFWHFIFIAQGAQAELETQLLLCVQLGYFRPEEINELLTKLDESAGMLYGLSNSLQ